MNSDSKVMKKIIEESEKLVEEALDKPIQTIKGKLSNYFNGIDWNKLNQGNGLFKMETYDDLKKLHSGPGFYVILTNYKNDDNNCKLIINNEIKAIYRGHCSHLKHRIESHLFNKKYNEEYSKRRTEKEKKGEKFSEVPFNACIKIDPNVNGIDIDDKLYSGYKWYVIQLKMPGSSRLIREQAEQAFDEVFSKPLASRE